jgi:hypothetical protein
MEKVNKQRWLAKQKMWIVKKESSKFAGVGSIILFDLTKLTQLWFFPVDSALIQDRAYTTLIHF